MRETHFTEESRSNNDLKHDLQSMLARPEEPGLPSSPLEDLLVSESDIQALTVLPAEVHEYQIQEKRYEAGGSQELVAVNRNRRRALSELEQVQRAVRVLCSQLGERDYDGQGACLDALEHVGDLIATLGVSGQLSQVERDSIDSHLRLLQQILYRLPYNNEAHVVLEAALNDQLFPVLGQLVSES